MCRCTDIGANDIPVYKKINMFSAMIPAFVDILCHRAPFPNKKSYLDKVPAEIITAFNKSTQ